MVCPNLIFNLLLSLFHITHAVNEVFDRAFEIMIDKNRQRLFEYTSLFESEFYMAALQKNEYSVFDVIVDDAWRKFPEMAPSSDEEVILLKRELVHFAIAGPTVQDEVNTMIAV